MLPAPRSFSIYPGPFFEFGSFPFPKTPHDPTSGNSLKCLLLGLFLNVLPPSPNSDFLLTSRMNCPFISKSFDLLSTATAPPNRSAVLRSLLRLCPRPFLLAFPLTFPSFPQVSHFSLKPSSLAFLPLSFSL